MLSKNSLIFSVVAFFAFPNASIAQETNQKKMHGVVIQMNEKIHFFEALEKIETILKDHTFEQYATCLQTGNLVILEHTYENAIRTKNKLEKAGFQIKLQEITRIDGDENAQVLTFKMMNEVALQAMQPLQPLMKK